MVGLCVQCGLVYTAVYIRVILKVCNYYAELGNCSDFTRRCRPVGATPALYSGAPGFVSSTRDPAVVTVFVVFLCAFISCQPHGGPGVVLASNRNEYQESSWG
jgi:hypothetical protein